jgi:hypothetical protein
MLWLSLLENESGFQVLFEECLVLLFSYSMVSFRILELPIFKVDLDRFFRVKTFQKTFEVADPELRVPTRQTLAKMIAEKAKEIEDRNRDVCLRFTINWDSKSIQAMTGQAVTISSDGYKGRGYELMSYVGSYVDGDSRGYFSDLKKKTDAWQMCQVTLGTVVPVYGQTAIGLATLSREVFERYAIRPFAAVADGAANAQAMIRELSLSGWSLSVILKPKMHSVLHCVLFEDAIAVIEIILYTAGCTAGVMCSHYLSIRPSNVWRLRMSSSSAAESMQRNWAEVRS